MPVRTTAEHAQEQQEDVEHIEEDPGGDRDRVLCRGSAQAVEVHDCVEPEDRQAGHGPCRVSGLDVDKDQLDPANDKRQQ